jgi:antibiotic biosynthesis monooxygenase (ABM) superfamily enzyme
MLSAAVPRQSNRAGPPSSWLVRFVTTLAAWLVAFALVTTLLALFNDELGSLPLAVRALVMSGVLVTFMANVAMPLVSFAVARWLACEPERKASVPPGVRKA